MRAAADLDPGGRQRIERSDLGGKALADHPAFDPVGDLPRRAAAMGQPTRVRHYDHPPEDAVIEK
jgi:hypothetical protein